MDYYKLGEIGYIAYAKKAENLTWDKKPMPTWDELPQNIKDRHAAAAEAIHHACV